MAMRTFGATGGPSGLAEHAFGSADRIGIERAVAELRAGRPVRVRHGSRSHLVIAAETAIAEWPRVRSLFCATDSADAPKLVLPMERLRYLGATVCGAAACDMAALVAETANALVFARQVDRMPSLVGASPHETAALDLIKFAQLVPAAIVGRAADPAAFEWTLSVTVDAVRSHHHEVANDLALIARTPVPLLDDADAEFVVFRGSDGLKDQVAIIVGDPDADKPVPIRLHSACLTGDLFGSLKCDCGEQLRRAVRTFAETGGGVLLYLDQEGRGIGLANKMRAYALQAEGYDTVDADAVLGYGPDERRYAIAARMVALLGYRRVCVFTNNPRKIAALNNHGIEVVDRIGLVGTVNPHNADYLRTKVERAGHIAARALDDAS